MFGFTLIEFSSFGLAENFFFLRKKYHIHNYLFCVCVCFDGWRSVTQSPHKYLNVEHSGCV